MSIKLTHFKPSGCLIKSVRVVGLWIFGVLVFCSSLNISASEAQQSPKQYFDAQSITLGGDGKIIVFGEGDNILITSANGVRLLPGIRIEAGSKVVVEVSVCAVPEVQEPCNSIMHRPDLLTAKFTSPASSFAAAPEPKEEISLQSGNHAVVPAASPHGNQLKSIRRSSVYTAEAYLQTLFTSPGYYLPQLAWGSRPENIKVLRT